MRTSSDPVRPKIAIPGRFTASASALRFGGVVNARALLDAVWAAGGDPVTLLPTDGVSPAAVAARLRGFDAVLMPGGADIDPAWYGQDPDVGTDAPDRLQDEFDVAVLRHAIDNGMPLLTVCRGTQLLNALLGGSLEQHMSTPHVTVTHEVELSDEGFLGSGLLEVSCYHHQCIQSLAPDLEAVSHASDGTIEAIRHKSASGWLRGVQWHPEDNAVSNIGQQRLMASFVAAASEFSKPHTHTGKESHASR